MTRREQKYITIICWLIARQRLIEAETNAYIVTIETQANAEIDRLRLAQIQADQIKIDTVLQSADDIWQELQVTEANVVRLKNKLKFKKRAMREE